MEFKDKNSFRVILTLLAITALLLLAHRFSMNRTLVIAANGDTPISIMTDQIADGNSIGELIRADNHAVLECEIKPGYQFPYCEMDFDLTRQHANGEIKGIDLSHFERIGVWARYEKRGVEGIRFNLLNYNPSYSVFGNNGTLKYSGVEFFGFNQTYPLWITLNSLQVATWWLVDYKINVENMAPEFTNVHFIKFATPSNASPGLYRLIVEKIVFEGKWISAKVLYRFILVLWIASALIFMARSLYRHRSALRSSQHKQYELEAMNRMLNFKSQELEDKSIHDPLTGVLNRNGLQKLIFDSEEALQMTDDKRGLCIVFMDIDKFKQINDTHGHNVGDEVLVSFVKLIQEKTRESDLLARWGGEEFILACLSQNLEDVTRLAEKLRVTVEQHPWPHDLNITCSFGVAKMGDEDTLEFINRADLALYQAKNEGRNRVVVSSAKPSRQRA